AQTAAQTLGVIPSAAEQAAQQSSEALHGIGAAVQQATATTAAATSSSFINAAEGIRLGAAVSAAAAGEMAKANVQAAAASTSAWGDFWGTLVQTAEGAVGTILGLIGKLLESLGITGGGGILAGIKGLVTGGGAAGGGAGGGQGILGTLSNVLGITGLAGKIFGAGSPLAGVGDFFQSALGGTITGLAKNLLSLRGTVLAVTTLFNRNASALSRTAAGLYATNQALNVFG